MEKRESADEVGRATSVRTWTVSEANARIRPLEELFPELRAWVDRLRVVHTELGRLTALWGGEIDARDLPDRRHKDQLDQEENALRARIEETVGGLGAEGIEIKDLERGIVDFYGEVGGELVYLCWRVGEEQVGFYHALDAGFRGRHPLPRGA